MVYSIGIVVPEGDAESSVVERVDDVRDRDLPPVSVNDENTVVKC